ncbi:MAG: MaoC family dehydratase [Ramlibacter sp.]|nr:MaoC family dehydratase [Ramlibacter sp.]
MEPIAYNTVTVGDALPPLTLPPVTRTMLALFAGASGDHNPIHIDTDYARKAGMPDVFAQGMLPAAYLGRLITNWAPQQKLRSFNMRFTGITHLGHQLTCRGRVAEKLERDGQRLVKIDVQALNQHGETKVTGEAWIAL